MKSQVVMINNEADLFKKELEIVSFFNNDLRIDMGFEKVIDKIIDSLIEKLNIDIITISLIDDDGYMFLHRVFNANVKDYSKESKDFWDQIFTMKWYVKRNNAWICKVAREDIEIYYPDINEIKLSNEEGFILNKLKIKGCYYLPIKLDNNIFGTMCFNQINSKYLITENEKKLIRKIVKMVAQTIYNMQKYEEIKNKYFKLEKVSQQLSDDIKLAQKIQKNFLPQGTPLLEKFDFAIKYIPMIDVGGDYYDFYYPRKTEGNKFGILITDASGHGIPAAFITSMVKMSFQSTANRLNASSPCKVLQLINNEIIDKIAGNFLTALYCFFEPDSMKLTVSNAGHNPLLLINRNDHTIAEIKPKGSILGLFENPDFKEMEITIHSGDRFILYTDGLSEALNKNDMEFEEKFMLLLKEHILLSAKELSDIIIHELNRHALYNGKSHFDDDVALIIIDVL